MRLRYFHIRHYPPLQDVEIVFSTQSPLNTATAIHFVVGINGSGKTHLLQALFETCLCLERKQTPKFPVTLIYETGKEKERKQTFVFDHDDDSSWWQSPDKFVLPPEAKKVEFRNILKYINQSPNSGWKPLVVDNGWPGSDIGLPSSVLAYTTGIPEGWLRLFEQQNTEDLDLSDEMEERPLGWSSHKERQNNPEFNLTENEQIEIAKSVVNTRTCQFINPLMLKLAVLAATLTLALEELKQNQTEAKQRAFITKVQAKKHSTGLRGLLSQVSWVWPVSIAFECQPTREWLQEEPPNSPAAKYLQSYQKAATTILAEPEPGIKQRVIFDLGNTNKKEALIELLNLSKSPFSIFQRLLDMHRHGVLDNVTIALRKADTDDILLFDELSDGEQMYLGRMALFHLLENQDDVLLLLDEPETHFNDRWKRDLVDILDQTFGEQANHVLISTHSGITLTDVFTNEITVIEKDEDGNAQHKELTGIHTFGATPDHPLRDVFGAPGTVGKRATALLDILLLCEPNKEVIEEYWQSEIGESSDSLLTPFIDAVIAEYSDKYDKNRIVMISKTLHNVANKHAAKPTVAAVAKYFADIVGPGYYQFDLYRAVYRLTEGKPENASQG